MQSKRQGKNAIAFGPDHEEMVPAVP